MNRKNLALLPVESVTNEQQEEDRVTLLVKHSGLQDGTVILKHIHEAHDLFVRGNDHSTIGEARSFVQALIDGMSEETNAYGNHTRGYPGGTANRMDYLRDVGFFTADEREAVGSAWRFLSAGSHPGIPSRDEARIALILSLEFGLFLLLKFENWKANGYRQFR